MVKIGVHLRTLSQN